MAGSKNESARLTARVTTAGFRGVPDGEVYPRVFKIGEIVEGELASVAIETQFADKESGPSGVKEVTRDFSTGPAAQPSSPRPVRAKKAATSTASKPSAPKGKSRSGAKSKSRK